jgi:hypothetical protein
MASTSVFVQFVIPELGTPGFSADSYEGEHVRNYRVDLASELKATYQEKVW